MADPNFVQVETIYLRGGPLDNMRKTNTPLVSNEVVYNDFQGIPCKYTRTTDIVGGETAFDYVEE